MTQNSSTLLRENGIVTRIDGKIAWVNTQSQLTCSSCKVESTCGNGILEKYLAGKIFVSKVENLLNARVGEQVEIAIPKSRVTHASLVVYLTPLIGLIFGALLGEYYFGSNLIGMLLGGIGFLLGFVWISIYSRKFLNNKDFIPVMLSKQPTQYASEAFDSIKIVNL